MNPHAEKLLSMSARDVIGSTIKFRSLKSNRTRTGNITSISASGVKLITLDRRLMIVGWSEILEVTNKQGVEA